MTETVGQRILRLRKRMGLTQDQLAEKVGVTAQAVSKWENDISMPDIQTIPVLAGILGVSTDELLGVSKPSEQPQKDSEQACHIHGGRGWLCFAVMLVIAGAAYILSHAVSWPFIEPESIWAVLWPAAVAGVGLSLLCERFSIFSLGVAVCGVYYLLFNMHIIGYELSWSIALAVLIILLGISLILDRTVFRGKRHWHGARDCEGRVGEKTFSDDKDGGINMSCSFGECLGKAEGPSFRRAEADISFGEGTLDLTSCLTAEAGAVIRAKVSFGELKVICPRGFMIEASASRSFGDIDIKGECSPSAAYRIALEGSVSFGSISVIYR